MPHPESIPKASRRKKYHYTYYFSDLWSGREIASELKSHTGIFSFQKNSTTRPHNCASYYRSTRYVVVEAIYIDHPSTTAKICRILHLSPICVLSDISKPLAKVLSNLWQKYCPTFGKNVFKRLAKVFSNVWQRSFQTLEKGLCNVWQRCYPTFDKSIIQYLIKVFAILHNSSYLLT